MWFALLGPLTIVDAEGEPVWVAAARQRILLAALLLNANHTVSCEDLCEAVWDGAPGPGAVATLRSYVMRLRRALGPSAGSRIAAHASGYQIRADESELDVRLFEQLCARADTAARAGDWTRADAVASQARDLWRAAPLQDVDSQVLRDIWLPRLENAHVALLETWAEAELRLGRHQRLVPELRLLTARHPLREHFHAQLMRALARGGLRAEALAAYQAARRVVVDELGIEPGPELRRLHERILAGDADDIDEPAPAEAAQPPAAATRTAASVPRQLPADVWHFAGRARELSALSGLAGRVFDTGGVVVAAIVTGTAGVGKTALALRWAHQHAHRFPDGQLYTNLRGFDPSGSPVDAGSAVRGFLAALGVAPTRIPADPDAQLSLYRSLLAHTRTLIVLDNARDADHVRPLLPSAAGCMVIVTSRSRLTSLVAVQGAMPLPLGLLSHKDAHALLARRLGARRVAREAAAAGEIVELCARLPLALNIAAARAATDADEPLDTLAGRFRDAHRRLDTLSAGDGAADIRAVLSSSYQTLDAAAARMFRLLGLHPGPDISVAAAASLAAVDAGPAGAALGRLAAAHLIDERPGGRYGFHDLLRAYAVERAAEQEAEPDRREATRRLLDHHLHTATAAFLVLRPGWLALDLDEPAAGVTLGAFSDTDTAQAWYDVEYPTLSGVMARACDAGFDDHAWRILWTWAAFLDNHGYAAELAGLSAMALSAAERAGDRLGQAFAHRWLGDAFVWKGSYPDALDHLGRALALYEDLGDSGRQGNTHRVISVVLQRCDDYAASLAHEHQALELYRAGGSAAGEAWALNGIGWCHALLKDYERALTYCRQALDLADRLGATDCSAATLDSLGYAHRHLGQYEPAIACFERAMRLWEDTDGRYYMADALIHLGDTHDAFGKSAAARGAWQRALGILDELQHPDTAELRAKLYPPR